MVSILSTKNVYQFEQRKRRKISKNFSLSILIRLSLRRLIRGRSRIVIFKENSRKRPESKIIVSLTVASRFGFKKITRQNKLENFKA